jgi:hypothetical protein
MSGDVRNALGGGTPPDIVREDIVREIVRRRDASIVRSWPSRYR